MNKTTDLTFLKRLLESEGYTVELEYRFHPTRKWRYDLAIPAQMLALEVQGGLFNHGSHVRGAHLLREYEKLNEAAILGWRVMFCTPQEVKTGRAYTLLRRALAAATEMPRNRARTPNFELLGIKPGHQPPKPQSG